ncbi:hypothetical protein [Nocardia sp. GAS34]
MAVGAVSRVRADGAADGRVNAADLVARLRHEYRDEVDGHDAPERA